MKALTEALRRSVSELEFCPIGDLYLFGSALRSSTYRDVDLLLVVESALIPLRHAHVLASPMLRAVEKASSVSVDLTLLSSDEEARDQFANLVQAELVAPAWHNKRIETDWPYRCAIVPAAHACR